MGYNNHAYIIIMQKGDLPMGLNLNLYNPKEEEIYNQLFEEMGIEIGKNFSIIPDNSILPLKNQDKTLVQYRDYPNEELKKMNKNGFQIFRPLRNFRHCELLMQNLYEDGKISEITITKNEDERNQFHGMIKYSDGNILKTNLGYFNETECRFALIWFLYFGEECKTVISQCNQFLIKLDKSLKKE